MMDIVPGVFTDPSFYKAIWPAFVLPLMMSFVVGAILWFQKKTARNIMLIVFSMALLGMVTGQLAGQSRDPAVTTVLPAVLGLLSALFTYILSVRDSRAQNIVAVSTVALISGLLFGTHFGVSLRIEYEQAANSEDSRIYNARVAHNLRRLQLVLDYELDADMRALEEEKSKQLQGAR